MPIRNILLAMFDIKPTGKSAGLIFSRIKQELNLQIKKESASEIKPKTVIEKSPPSYVEDNYWEELVAKLPQRPDFPLRYQLSGFSKEAILKELERTMGEQVDIAAELVSIGGQVHRFSSSKPRVKIKTAKKMEVGMTIEPENPVLAGKELEEFWVTAAPEPEAETAPVEADLAVDNHSHSPASREIEVWLENIQRNRKLLTPAPNG